MAVADSLVFPIRFTGVNRWMWLIGVRRSASRVEVSARELRVRLGWGFRMRAPLASVQAVEHDGRPVRAWGAHGWGGRWLVNGSSQGLVRIDLDPPAVALVLFLRPRVHELRVSVDDPDGLIAALGAAADARR
jgi:hypothetical protein